MKTTLISISLLFISIASLAQYSVHGQVLDIETNLPLANATVFIANTTKGTSTDTEGKFEIGGLKNIHYNLVVSFLGYEPVVFDIVPGSSTYEVKLKPTARVLNEVVVKAKGISKTDLQDFKNNFIGFSDNADKCSLENEEAITFNRDKDVLTATCDTVLMLRNDGLGYRIKIILQRYQYNSKKQTVIFEGQMSYEPLKAPNEKENKHWAENRLKAYYGSEMHFFRALYNHRLNEEGFYFYFQDMPGSDSLFRATSRALNWYPVEVRTLKDYTMILDPTLSVEDEAVLALHYPLSVSYINEAESFVYQRKREMPLMRSMQKSLLKSNQPGIVLPDGRLYPVDAAEASGYWSWELMAEALPLDYNPEDDRKLLDKKR